MRTRRMISALGLILVLASTSLPGGSPVGAAAVDSDEQWDYVAESVSGQYEPVAGNFAGDFASDIYWYAPGAPVDTLYIGNDGVREWTKVRVEIDDDAVPVVGDFGGDELDDIIWYRAGSGIDRVWIATGGEEVFDTSGTVTLNGTYVPEVLRDWREGKKDRVFWYRAGDGTDPLWIFKPDGSHTVVTEQVRNTLQVVAGDWSGDGVEDLLLYGPGTLPDRVWTSHAGPFTSRSITINGRYQAVAVLGIPFDEVLLFGTGDKPDRYMHNTGSGFQTQPVLLPARGKAYTAGLGAAIVYSPLDFENIVIDDDDTAGSYYLSESRDVGPGHVPLIGNFENDDFLDVFWYGKGTNTDEVWYGHNPDLAEAPFGRHAPDGTDRRPGRANRP